MLSKQRPVSYNGQTHHFSPGRRLSAYTEHEHSAAPPVPAVPSMFTLKNTESMATVKDAAVSMRNSGSPEDNSHGDVSNLEKGPSTTRGSFEVTSRRKSYIANPAASHSFVPVADSPDAAPAVPLPLTNTDTETKEDDGWVPPLPVNSMASIVSVTSARTNVSSSINTAASEASTSVSREESAATSLVSCSEDGHGDTSVSISAVSHQLGPESGADVEDAIVSPTQTTSVMQMGFAISTDEMSLCHLPPCHRLTHLRL